MEEEDKIPRLLEFLFGEAAGAARQGASPRLLAWCRAFDEWLGERLGSYSRSTHKQAWLTWKRLLRERRKMPWELGPADIQAHAAWMQAKGYAASTTANMVGIIANFYTWCGERRVDPQCTPGFNPAAGVARPKVRRYDRAALLSRGEVQALLGILKRDSTPLGRREYAFFLARLNFGVPLKSLHLQWEQIEQEAGQAWVRWRPEAAPVRLPGEVWEAILAYLEAAGRLAGMRAEAYVFAPLAEPGKEETGREAKDWLEERCVSSSTLLASLKIYGRPAGIPEEKLTLQALRRTAVRLRLDECGAEDGGAGDGGASTDGEAARLEAMKVFLDSQEESKSTKHRLSLLPQLPQEEERSGEEAEEEPSLPERQAKPFKTGDGLIHGWYARSQPDEAVREIMAKDIQGVDEEYAALGILEHGLLERIGGASRSDQAHLVAAHTRTSYRLGTHMKAEKLPAASGEVDTWPEEVLTMLDDLMLEQGRPPVSEAAWEEMRGGKPKLDPYALSPATLIARSRLVLRTTFEAAMEAREIADYARWVNLYSNGFIQLVRLVNNQQSEVSRMKALIIEDFNLVSRQLTENRGCGAEDFRF